MNKLFQLYALSGLLITGAIGASENYQPNLNKIDGLLTKLSPLLLPQSNWTQFNNWLFARKVLTISDLLTAIYKEVKDVKENIYSLSNPHKIHIHNWNAGLWLKKEKPYIFVGFSELIEVPEDISQQDKDLWQDTFGVVSGTVGKGVYVSIELTPEQIKALSPITWSEKSRITRNLPELQIIEFSNYYSPASNTVCRLRRHYGSTVVRIFADCSVYTKQLEQLLETHEFPK